MTRARHSATLEDDRGDARVTTRELETNGARRKMVFGISSTSTAIAIAIAIAMVGPKDAPALARAAGKASGRVVARVAKHVKALNDVSATVVDKEMKREFTASVNEIRAVAKEIERGLNPLSEREANGTRTRATERARGETSEKAVRRDLRYSSVVHVSARDFDGETRARDGSGAEVLAASFRERAVALRARELLASGEVDAYLASRSREEEGMEKGAR